MRSRGQGESGGDFGDTDFSSNVDDLVSAAGHLRDRFQTPVLLVGHSLGGAARARVPGVATIAATADPAHVAHLPAAAVRRSNGRARPGSCSVAAPSASTGSSSTTAPDSRRPSASLAWACPSW
ncbi:alpha/beta hydrolase [Streptomyces sp. NPDC001156]